MKAWVLADSRSGYVWNWKLYAGKEDTADMSVGLATRVVLELAHDLEKKGYHLYCDNYYSSPELFTRKVLVLAGQPESTGKAYLWISRRPI